MSLMMLLFNFMVGLQLWAQQEQELQRVQVLTSTISLVESLVDHYKSKKSFKPKSKMSRAKVRTRRDINMVPRKVMTRQPLIKKDTRASKKTSTRVRRTRTERITSSPRLLWPRVIALYVA